MKTFGRHPERIDISLTNMSRDRLLVPASLEFKRFTIGSTKDWFPSRKSVASQRGGFSNVLDGHCRSSNFKGVDFRYFRDGS